MHAIERSRLKFHYGGVSDEQQVQHTTAIVRITRWRVICVRLSNDREVLSINPLFSIGLEANPVTLLALVGAARSVFLRVSTPMT